MNPTSISNKDPSLPQSKTSDLEIKKASDEIADEIRSEIQDKSLDYLEQLKDVYVKEASKASVHQTEALEQQKMKNYQQLLDMKRSQQRDLGTIRNRGEQDLLELGRYYDGQKAQLISDRQHKLNTLQNENTHNIENEENDHKSELARQQEKQQLTLSESQDQFEKQKQRMLDDSTKLNERLDQKNATRLSKSKEHFHEQYQSITQEHQTTLNEIKKRAEEQIRDSQEKNQSEIRLFEAREDDPFYRSIRLDHEMSEDTDFLSWSFDLPKHEQDNFGAFVQGDSLVVSFFRKNLHQEKFNEGGDQTTGSYQSYTKKIPMPWPVNPKGMTKEIRENQIIIKLPKLKYEPYRGSTRSQNSPALPT